MTDGQERDAFDRMLTVARTANVRGADNMSIQEAIAVSSYCKSDLKKYFHFRLYSCIVINVHSVTVRAYPYIPTMIMVRLCVHFSEFAKLTEQRN